MGGAGGPEVMDSSNADPCNASLEGPVYSPSPTRRRAPVTPPQDTRLTPVPYGEWDEHTREVLLSHLRRPEIYLSGAPDAPPMPIVLELFAHHLPLSEAWLTFSDLLASADARLDPAHRELLILRVAWRTRSGYEWNQHHRMGAAEGLSDAQLQAVREGPDSAVWTPEERSMLRAADEMIEGFSVSEETWQQLASWLGAAELFELLFVVGGYLCLATVLNSIGLQAEMPADPTGSSVAAP
jgi:4-carboxymuconolactone decarboxylase